MGAQTRHGPPATRVAEWPVTPLTRASCGEMPRQVRATRKYRAEKSPGITRRCNHETRISGPDFTGGKACVSACPSPSTSTGRQRKNRQSAKQTCTPASNEPPIPRRSTNPSKTASDSHRTGNDVPIPFTQRCQCETAKTRANDGKGYFWCRHCDRICGRTNCPTCKRYARDAVRDS